MPNATWRTLTQGIPRNQTTAHAAVHEAGHATLATILFPATIEYATIIEAGGVMGSVKYSCTNASICSRQESMNVLAVAMAGRAAEEIEFGYSIDLGSFFDYGVVRNHLCSRNANGRRLHESKDFLIDVALKRAHEILVKERELFHQIIAGLIRENRLDRAALLALQ
ncbi:MAG: hypothetical protein AAB473_03415 [Patescibacteria group bacterium]